MACITTSAPGKIILYGDHGVHRQQPNIVTSIDLRTYCRVTVRNDNTYVLRSGKRIESAARQELLAFRTQVDALRERKDVEQLSILGHPFFAPTRLALANAITLFNPPGLDIEWFSQIPVGSGLGSGAAASCSLALAVACAAGIEPKLDDIIYCGWQGDVIAHGGYGSSLDSSTIVLGQLVQYSLEKKANPLSFNLSLPLVVGDTQIIHSTGAVNTHIRLWLQEHPERIHIFRDMTYLFPLFLQSLEAHDLVSLGHIWNLHQLLQEKMGTSIPELDSLIEASLRAGALGAKICGSGGGGTILALSSPEGRDQIAAAIEAVGGKSYRVNTGVPGVRREPNEIWDEVSSGFSLS
jgi:mevalonate kinase